MDREEDRLDREEEKLPQQNDSERIGPVSGVDKLYRFTYNQPDALLGLILTLMDNLEEKGILSNEEITNIIAEGLSRWQNRS